MPVLAELVEECTSYQTNSSPPVSDLLVPALPIGLPALIKARAEKQNESDAVRSARAHLFLYLWLISSCVSVLPSPTRLQDDGDSYEDDTSDSSEHSHTWFSMEKGTTITCNSSTMKASISEAKKP